MPDRHDEERRRDRGLTREEVEARREAFERRNRQARREAARQPRPTLGEVAEHNDWLWLYCDTPGCRHYTAVPLAPLIVRWGPTVSSDVLRTRFRCSRCERQTTSVRATSSPRAKEPMDVTKQWTGRQDWHPALGAFSVEAMCNAYSMTKSREAIRALFRISDNRAPAIVPPQAEIWPYTPAPVVRLAEDGERELVTMTFAFPLQRKGLTPKPVSNIRDDKAMKIWFWRESFNLRRCLVPATSYCDPEEKQPGRPVDWHWFALEPAAERPLFACPGVWKPYQGILRKKDPPVDTNVFAFMTTLPNSLSGTINHERMPVIFTEEHQFETWLRGTPEEAHALVHTFPAERMRIVQSGAKMKDLLGAPADTATDLFEEFEMRRET